MEVFQSRSHPPSPPVTDREVLPLPELLQQGGVAPGAEEEPGQRDGRRAAAAASGWATGQAVTLFRIGRSEDASSDPHHRQLETCIFTLCR